MCDALQTFKNIGSPSTENVAEILTVVRRKYVRPQSTATAKKQILTTNSQSSQQEANYFFG